MSDRASRAKEASSAGKEAFREGLPREANHFREGTLEHWAFDVGWRVEERFRQPLRLVG